MGLDKLNQVDFFFSAFREIPGLELVDTYR